MSRKNKECHEADGYSHFSYSFNSLFDKVHSLRSKIEEKCDINIHQNFNESLLIDTFDSFFQFLMARVRLKIFCCIKAYILSI